MRGFAPNDLTGNVVRKPDGNQPQNREEQRGPCGMPVRLRGKKPASLQAGTERTGKRAAGADGFKNGKYANGKGPSYWSAVAVIENSAAGILTTRITDTTAHGGVTVCEEWQSFRGFEAWALNNGYRKG